MQQLPFHMPGRFYRGNLHTHSDRSDGVMSPELVIQAYERNGYDFLVLTDHFLPRYDYPITDTTGFRSETFTTLLGAELHAPALQNGEAWHIVAVGLPPDFPPPGANETGPQLAARAREAGAYVGIAHPAWYGLTPEDARTLDAAHAVEVYNETCVMDNDRGDSWYLTDLLLTEGRRLNVYGSDDAHFRPDRPDAHGAWVMVRAESLDPSALLAALRAGHYYTSQGPRIHDISIDEHMREISISTSPAASIYVSGRASLHVATHGRGITSTTFPLEKFHGSYCRVTVVDSAGKKAWSNPVWLG